MIISQSQRATSEWTNLEGLSVDDETTVELVLEELQLVSYLIRCFHCGIMLAQRSGVTNIHVRFATWWMY